MVSDMKRLVVDLLKLGVCFRTKLTENDLGVYVEMVDKNLTDRQWSYALDYFTGNWTDPGEAPKFMPSPQELISIGRSIGGATEINIGPTPEQLEFRRLYWEQATRQRIEAQANRKPAGHREMLRSMDEASERSLPLSDEEWEARRRFLMAQADELFHEGECPK